MARVSARTRRSAQSGSISSVANPFDEIPAGARQEAMRQVESMQRHMDLAQAAQGRSAQAATQWSRSVRNVGGASGNALQPSDPSTIYIGAAQGGVWKTTDGGASWTIGLREVVGSDDRRGWRSTEQPGRPSTPEPASCGLRSM